jgi:hypothetical protein
LNRLPRIQRWLVYASSALLVITGLAWAFVHYFGDAAGLDSRAALAFNASMMKLHGGAAMAALIVIGALLPHHVPGGWTAKLNRKSGVTTLVVASMLVLTGYLLYYTGDETYREFASYFHLGAELAFAALLIFHIANLPGVRAAVSQSSRQNSLE